MGYEVVGKILFRRSQRKWTESHGYVDDGVITSEARVAVDVEKLVDILGPKAIRTKKRRSMLCSGAVVVELFNTKHIPAVKPTEANEDDHQ
jgi:hypothetical protein